MKDTLPLLLFLLSCIVGIVQGHGFVYKATISSSPTNSSTKTYTGNIPGDLNPFPSVIREISTQDPVLNASNPDLNCGPDGAVSYAEEFANAMPGSDIWFDWRVANLSAWPHNTGPMLTYMTSCGSSNCTAYNSSLSKWFKIQELGWKTDGSGEWAQADLMKGATAKISLPSNLAPGFYLIRHEIISLHQAGTIRGAQFYPSCTQLNVGGNQTGAPVETDLVFFPGAYKDDDPGLYDPNNNFYDPNANYTFPGPPIASFITPSSSANGSTTPPPSTTDGRQHVQLCRLTKPHGSGPGNVNLVRLGVDSVLSLPRDLSAVFSRSLSMNYGSWDEGIGLHLTKRHV